MKEPEYAYKLHSDGKMGALSKNKAVSRGNSYRGQQVSLVRPATSSLGQNKAARMKIAIRQIGPHDLSLCHEHFARHKIESGQDGVHFMPYEQHDEDGPIGPVSKHLVLPLSEPRWQRWFVALPDGKERIVGHVNLSGSPLKTSLHRCELGIGIEHPYRQSGIGKKLMETAIQFARQAESLSWIDIFVFANNKPARALYKGIGFVEVSILSDRFRIGNSSIDDVAMALEVAQ